MVLSGLKENVILTKLYLPYMAPDKGELVPMELHPLEKRRHTYQCEKCVCPLPHGMEVTAYCGVAVMGITSDGKQRCLARLHPTCGELELTKVPVEGWIIDLYEHGFLDGLDNAMSTLIQFPED